MSAAHTPTPWVAGWNGGLTGPRCAASVWLDSHKPGYDVIATGNRLVAIVPSGEGDSKIDAEHIVRCVNAHDDLVAALRDMMAVEAEAMSGSRDRGPAMTADTVARFSRARAALAKVAA